MLPPTKLGTGLPEPRGPASLPEKALTLCESHLSSYSSCRSPAPISGEGQIAKGRRISHRPDWFCHDALATQTMLGQNGLITCHIAGLYIVQQTATQRHHGQQAAT